MNTAFNVLLADLKANLIPFSQVIKFIEMYYQHQSTAFKNGETFNEVAQNQGSAKVNELNEADTLYLFAEHYKSVLANPDSTDHQNIRQYMANGWNGIVFEGEALVAKV